MRPEVLGWIVAMGVVTYGARLLLLLSPLRGELQEQASPYLRLVAPAVLSALAAVAALVGSADGRVGLSLDNDLLPIVLGLATTAWRRNLAMGIAVGVVSAMALRAWV